MLPFEVFLLTILFCCSSAEMQAEIRKRRLAKFEVASQVDPEIIEDCVMVDGDAIVPNRSLNQAVDEPKEGERVVPDRSLNQAVDEPKEGERVVPDRSLNQALEEPKEGERVVPDLSPDEAVEQEPKVAPSNFISEAAGGKPFNISFNFNFSKLLFYSIC